MLLARGAGRTREMAIRVAIGAGRSRIFRQLLVESLILALAGGIAGWLVALAGLKWFDVGVTSLNKPVWMQLSPDPAMFAYMAAISIGAGVLSGFAPAWRLMAQAGVNGFLKDGGHGSVGGRGSSRLANALIVFQMVLCVVLLAAAGLMTRSASRIYGAPIGVPTSDILVSRIKLPAPKYPDPGQRIEFHRTAHDAIEALPSVATEAVASAPPLGGWDPVDAQLQSETAAQRLSAIIVSPSYFRLFDLNPLMGRVFVQPDEVVVNQSFARKYWSGGTAVGQHLRLTDGPEPHPWLTVVGVVPDVLQNARDRLAFHPLIYLSYERRAVAQTYMLVRTRVPAASIVNAVRAEVQKIDPNLPLVGTVTLQSRLDSARLEVSVFGWICSVFAAIALVLATVGLYSVIAHSVNIRAQEIGLRIAMGGTPRDILNLVFRQGMRPLLIGLVVGVPLAMAAMRMLSGSLVGVGPSDPLTFGAVIVVLLAAGVLGCLIPARRATRVDPVVALRCQ